MDLPKFLLADSSEFEDAFILHTEFPRFILNVNTDEVEWFDDVEDEEDLENQVKNLIEEAFEFFENEIEAYEGEEDEI
ncbi:hypothetical protein GO491_07715 [Flavobacteriaceae bacterium Ap0902]|nr:hypothetical protein [Flavobacteriaceae bacterium Ap0902]